MMLGRGVFGVVVGIMVAGCTEAPARSVDESDPASASAPAVTATPEPALSSPAPTSTAAATSTATARPSASSSPEKPATQSVDLNASGEPPAGVPAAAYAALFDPSASWKLSGTKEHSSEMKKEKKGFKATCKVARVTRHSFGVRSTIACVGLPQAGSINHVEGDWVATPSGLYHLGSDAKGIVELSDERMIVENPPRAAKHVGGDEGGDGGPDGSFERERTVDKGRTCFSESSALGDEGWSKVCLDTSGFVSGQFGWAGGASEDVVFNVAPAKKR